MHRDTSAARMSADCRAMRSQGSCDSKGRSLVSKDLRTPRDSISIVDPRRKAESERERERGEGVGRFAESLLSSLLRLSRAGARARLPFSRILRFSILGTTPVRFEPRVRVQPRERKPVRSAWLTRPASRNPATMR